MILIQLLGHSTLIGKKPKKSVPLLKRIGHSFAIDNDANVAALGERWVGAGENNPDVVFMTLGTGVGGGIIADGNLIHGVAGAGGEIGHMIVEPENGFACTCGSHGCLETVASATGVVKVARLLAEAYEGIQPSKQLLTMVKVLPAKIFYGS